MDERPLSKVRVRAHLKKAWKRGGGCAVCGDNAWEVYGEEFYLTGTESSQRLPLCPVLCVTCGNTLLIASHIIRRSMKP